MSIKRTKQNLKWLCLDCNYVFESDDSKWHMNMCPKCKRNGVDHEDYYVRMVGNVKQAHGNSKPGQKSPKKIGGWLDH